MARFCLLFGFYNVVLGLLTSTPAADRHLRGPIARGLAFLSGFILSPFGEVYASGIHLNYNGFGVQIGDACDGILPTTIYLSAVLAFPSRWIDKGWGILIGLSSICLINLVRLVTLMIVGAAWHDAFETVHIYVWQAVVVGLSMAVWIFWAERFVRPRPGSRP